MKSLDEIKEEVLRVVRARGQASFEEIRGQVEARGIWLRRAVAELVRGGLLVRVPDYEAGRHVFRVRSER